MTALTNDHDLHDHDDHHHHEAEAADRYMFGFWLYIISDCLLFATLFATYAVMGQNFNNEITPYELFDLGFVAVETALLLLSSFTFGMAMLGANAENMAKMKLWLIITALLGLSFLGMEIYEFVHFSHEGATPQTSGYWTSFYSLVATHGLHVTAGLIWMAILFVHFNRDGFTNENKIRLSCLSLFWHFLDIIWICVFSFVYLRGAM
ncbi:cytochrome o ubiquinol oxidase subunit III [Marinomonas sp. IMCC 4694]|uniref:cytochrome o ubiquinol oxidase subunit III n=1 Tax=Marinomonas sp. IMCC 4694 TaxID=2605432 RepID=UPI0011E7086B|nr:cytochrome o ubiquinol oxidase subunit III [Marinomonas sp. IMCC 4694]TYL46530.1 cytochrome o ubiquinol oxidase subunit III [Marinomonas sp. IMCC 4694]